MEQGKAIPQKSPLKDLENSYFLEQYLRVIVYTTEEEKNGGVVKNGRREKWRCCKE
jgi:hypothetical protein